jgi:redoxin
LAKNGLTLLLILSSDCDYCSESAPFYQRLAKEIANQDGVRIVAVLPQAVSEGQKYLNKLGVSVTDVKQAAPPSVGAIATPTLILVNNEGVVADSWVGKLKPNDEASLMMRLHSSAKGL